MPNTSMIFDMQYLKQCISNAEEKYCIWPVMTVWIQSAAV